MSLISDKETIDPLSRLREKNIENRELLINSLKKEFIGMEPFEGEEIDCSGDISFEKEEVAYRPYIQKDSGQEIIQRGTPLARYGTAILFPTGQVSGEDLESKIETEVEDDNENLVDKKSLEKIEKRQTDKLKDASEEFDISPANSFKPNSMALSFKGKITSESKLIIRVKGGRYVPKKIGINEKEREWWLRVPVEGMFLCSGKDLLENTICTAILIDSIESLKLDVKVVSRPQNDGTRLLTVGLTNRTDGEAKGKIDSNCLFQAEFIVTIDDPENQSCILAYPESENFNNLDDEEKSIAMLYRNLKTFAIGHGCAADWGDVQKGEKVKYVKTEFLPTYETRSMTPDIKRKDGTRIEVSMKQLAGLETGNEGFEDLEEIIELYREWIENQTESVVLLDPKFHKVAYENLNICSQTADRMENGLKYLKTNANALTAFRFANHSVLLQQISGEQREGIIEDDTLIFHTPYKEPDLDHLPGTKGKWRAFQIAFLLMSIHSAGEKESKEREIVDLIFFPTGGGKTEAYLGLAAFSMFMRRIKDKNDAGVDVIMRYTLRLLTADQFQRTSRLICAMEFLRRQNVKLLGPREFSIGIWLGSDTTPNSNKKALESLKKIKSGKTENNPFILNTCPWCGAKLGEYKVKTSKSKVKSYQKKPKNKIAFLGYKGLVDKVITHCPDQNCIFFEALPVYIVDEEIYKERPTFIIGTVDKFAMLAWNSDIRSLFGINEEGRRELSPPGLIIQDELHLISGPLGSLTGFFETIIDEFCTDRRFSRNHRAKIVCSTATIRRYKEQVSALYARDQIRLFPSPGLNEEDSFFATYALDTNGELMPGRKYVGINTPILGSMQTLQVRALTTLLQTPMQLPDKERDPWWTLLLFFNSLRELGTTITLMHSDIPNHLKVLRNRFGINFDQIRRLRRIEELTSRLSNDEVSVAIDKLKQKYDDTGKVIDISLASNIIEVGVDIDRLSLMSVTGQPKTTAQYIQVTGRVGRRWYERPGLIVTLYSATKPRDRSHFEKFRSYHQMLYAQVEPTSVTPFSPRVIDRALHAVMVAYVRQTGEKHNITSPRPFPEDLLSEIEHIILERVKKVDKAELESVKSVFNKRKREWRNYEPLRWSGNPDGDDYPLLRVAGQYADSKAKRLSWATMMSMRNVDAQCKGKITDLYLDIEED
ncbi:helicase-related protein [Mesobacillus jeotgali]|uniref:Helicase-related protein n=1 Tax=Mesobacillus jeotgali TaxID=129985 RepID=A0ABY9VK47_9BACI|nr:helicase-related protein [Mesobacillus jeotgali]WNF21316.1 helicase-related protein [Mesobacillus jeotgali]